MIRSTALALSILFAPSLAVAARGDLRRHSLIGPLTASSVGALRRAIAETHRRREIVLLEIDSPGGALHLGEKAMIAILFSGAPVVAYVPSGARASGASTLSLMAAGIVAAAPDARVGTPNGLGRNAELRLGEFGTRIFDAALASRSAAADWLVVSLAEGSQVDGRGARARGVASLLARDVRSLARALRGKDVPVPLTGERVRSSGRLVSPPGLLRATIAGFTSAPSRSPIVALAGLTLVALLASVRPTFRAIVPAGALVAIGAVALAGVPVLPAGALLTAFAVIAAWATPHMGARAAALYVVPAIVAPVFLVDSNAAGYYVANDAGPSWAVSILAGAIFALVLGWIGWRARRRGLAPRTA